MKEGWHARASPRAVALAHEGFGFLKPDVDSVKTNVETDNGYSPIRPKGPGVGGAQVVLEADVI